MRLRICWQITNINKKEIIIINLTEKYLETFTNKFGETWWFDYDKENDMGILWGNDSLIVGNKFYVFSGMSPSLILGKDERDWLRSVWKKYSYQGNTKLYQ